MLETTQSKSINQSIALFSVNFFKLIDILPYLFLGVVKECAKQRKIMREKEKKNFDKNRRNEKRDSFNDKKEKILR